MAYDKLLSPLTTGAVDLPNRVVMAPLTRSRAPNRVPGALNATYYAQRASAGLIISEATSISPTAVGYAYTPGIWSDEHEIGWKQVVDAVHGAGGRIAVQLWHVGRVSHELVQPNGQQPVAPSAIRAENTQVFVEYPDGSVGQEDTAMPRALESDEIPGIVDDYRNAARHARNAGFDMAEVHAANAYLLQQFLASSSNRRSDAYGGSLENRARLTLEAVDAVIGVYGADRVGIRLSPFINLFGLHDDQTTDMPFYLAEQLSQRGIAYIHINEPDWAGGEIHLSDEFRRAMRERFNGTLIFCGNYSAERAEKLIEDGIADAVAFGRPYIANPDLVERFRQEAPLNEPDPATFYGGGAEGYTDYPTLG